MQLKFIKLNQFLIMSKLFSFKKIKFFLIFLIISCSKGDGSILNDSLIQLDPNIQQISQSDSEEEVLGCSGKIPDANFSGDLKTLIWSDEFDQDGSICDKNWYAETIPPNNGSWWNNEFQYYTDRPDNLLVENGTLKITAKREKYLNKDFTSARIVSKGLFSFMYGKIEVRAKLAKGGGTWPAIWMLGDNFDQVDWPQCGEIDIMEHDGFKEGRIHTTVHRANDNGDPVYFTSLKNEIKNVTEEFHVYSLVWNNQVLTFYIDDIAVYSYNNQSIFPYNQTFFIILNVAMGGNFVGNKVDADFESGTMEIDYVRVYK